jgi:crotonobetainyl-CoA:carnitine CoA-transferase CaiB-like acyl-CoA transferase
MADHGNHDENYTSNAGVMYESSDANVRAIYIFGVWLVVLGALCALATYGGLRYLEYRETNDNKARVAENPMVPEARMTMPPIKAAHEFPAPRLQVNDTAEMKEEIQEETGKLTHYQWVDENQGIVRIPIDKAMQLVLQRGLPARAGGANAVAAPAAAAKPAAKPAVAKKSAPPKKPASQQVR